MSAQEPTRPAALLCFTIILFCLGQGTAAPQWREKRAAPTCSRKVDVAIVGAGPSGAYTAYRLRESGQTIELFEYSDRIGGRLYTTRLPNTPDVNLEIGGMRWIEGVHVRVQSVIDELNLTPVVFSEGFGKSGRMRYYLRGESLTKEDVKYGDVPYDLSPEEKANQANIWAYYLEKLTGFNESVVMPEQLLHLRVADGRELYKLTFDEAFDLVATPEGKEFARGIEVFESEAYGDAGALSVFDENLGWHAQDGEVYTLKEGMDAIPKTLVQNFLDASESNNYSPNRKLNAIFNEDDGSYRLNFVKTRTKEGYTRPTGRKDIVCAGKVVLAIPQLALTKLKWTPLRRGKVAEALNAVRPSPASKVFMTFSKPWWTGEDAEHFAWVMKSDEPFSQSYDWKVSNETGDAIMIASYADLSKTLHLEELNEEGDPIPGSAPGFNRVTDTLSTEILDHLAEVFGVERQLVPEPITAISQWWSQYPFGGGWVTWRAGYHYQNVIDTIRRPSLTDDIYTVGVDQAFGHSVAWIEGAFETVDDLLDVHFS